NQCRDSIIEDNLILDNTGDSSGVGSGIALQAFSRNNVVRGNTIRGNGGYGILVQEGAKFNRFRRNKIVANYSGGILINVEDPSDPCDPNANPPCHDFGINLGDPGNNCIQGNANSGLDNRTDKIVKAQGNFWGCAAGPNNSGCDRVTGPVDFSNPMPM